MRLRPIQIGSAAAALILLGAVGLVVAQEAAPPAPADQAAPAARPALGRDYSIGTVGPDDTAKGEAAPADPQAAPPAPEAKSADPMKRPRYGSAILQAVDKVTAESLRFEAKVGEPVRFKGLVVTVNTCETTATDEDAPDSIAHLSVLSQPEGVTAATARDAFRGWMYANAPAVHPFQHPVYDLWLIACKAVAPSASVGMK